MMRASLLFGLVVLVGCHQLEPAPAPLRPIKHDEPAGSVTSNALPPEANEHGRDRGAPPGAIAPRATIEQVEPGHEALAQAMLSASRPSMEECRANSGGGVLKLRVVSDKSRERITIDPGSTVTDSVRHCVLEALSTLDVPDSLSQSSPSSRPSSGFSSIISVNW